MKPQEFVKKVVESYESHKGVFANRVNAEELAPNTCTPKDKALYLFYVIQLDYATKSSRLYEGAKKLWNENSNFFKPSYILNLKQTQLEAILKKYLKPRYINEAKKRFIQNSQMLRDKYESDPKQIFEHSSSAKEALTKVGEFRGFGPKIGNFFVRTMVNTFEYRYKDIEEILPPVDVWDVKIAFLLGYTDSDAMTQKNIMKVKRIWNEACLKSNESWLTFDKALWLLGSEGKPKTKEDVLELIK